MSDKVTVVLGFDFGTKYIGVAIGQAITQTASPLDSIRVKDNVFPQQPIQKLIDEWRPQAFILGLPLNMDGSEQPLTAQARQFGQQLQKAFQLPIYEVDERLSTVEAKAQLAEQLGVKATQDYDKVNAKSACLLVEQWLKGG